MSLKNITQHKITKTVKIRLEYYLKRDFKTVLKDGYLYFLHNEVIEPDRDGYFPPKDLLIDGHVDDMVEKHLEEVVDNPEDYEVATSCTDGYEIENIHVVNNKNEVGKDDEPNMSYFAVPVKLKKNKDEKCA